jgi:cysteine synthase
MNVIGNTPLIKLERLSEPGCAEIQRAKIIGSGKKIVAIICDSGLKYLNGDLYR